MACSEVILLFGSITKNRLSCTERERERERISNNTTMNKLHLQWRTNWKAVVSDLMLCLAMYLCRLQPWYWGFSRPKSLISVLCSGILRMSSQSFSGERESTFMQQVMWLSRDHHMTHQRGSPLRWIFSPAGRDGRGYLPPRPPVDSGRLVQRSKARQRCIQWPRYLSYKMNKSVIQLHTNDIYAPTPIN